MTKSQIRVILDSCTKHTKDNKIYTVLNKIRCPTPNNPTYQGHVNSYR